MAPPGGWKCLTCGTRFPADLRFQRGAAWGLGVLALALAWQQMFLPFAGAVLAAIFLYGPPKCPSCKQRSTMRATPDDQPPENRPN